jgi:hypothetical protein
MKTHPEALKILVALAKEARVHLHYCNIFLRDLKKLDQRGVLKYLFGYSNLQDNYLQEQEMYCSSMNALLLAKSAVNRRHS